MKKELIIIGSGLLIFFGIMLFMIAAGQISYVRGIYGKYCYAADSKPATLARSIAFSSYEACQESFLKE